MPPEPGAGSWGGGTTSGVRGGAGGPSPFDEGGTTGVVGAAGLGLGGRVGARGAGAGVGVGRGRGDGVGAGDGVGTGEGAGAGEGVGVAGAVELDALDPAPLELEDTVLEKLTRPDEPASRRLATRARLRIEASGETRTTVVSSEFGRVTGADDLPVPAVIARCHRTTDPTIERATNRAIAALRTLR